MTFEVLKLLLGLLWLGVFFFVIRKPLTDKTIKAILTTQTFIILYLYLDII